jgi:hypothetical protein
LSNSLTTWLHVRQTVTPTQVMLLCRWSWSDSVSVSGREKVFHQLSSRSFMFVRFLILFSFSLHCHNISVFCWEEDHQTIIDLRRKNDCIRVRAKDRSEKNDHENNWQRKRNEWISEWERETQMNLKLRLSSFFSRNQRQEDTLGRSSSREDPWWEVEEWKRRSTFSRRDSISWRETKIQRLFKVKAVKYINAWMTDTRRKKKTEKMKRNFVRICHHHRLQSRDPCNGGNYEQLLFRGRHWENSTLKQRQILWVSVKLYFEKFQKEGVTFSLSLLFSVSCSAWLLKWWWRHRKYQDTLCTHNHHCIHSVIEKQEKRETKMTRRWWRFRLLKQIASHKQHEETMTQHHIYSRCFPSRARSPFLIRRSPWDLTTFSLWSFLGRSFLRRVPANARDPYWWWWESAWEWEPKLQLMMMISYSLSFYSSLILTSFYPNEVPLTFFDGKKRGKLSRDFSKPRISQKLHFRWSFFPSFAFECFHSLVHFCSECKVWRSIHLLLKKDVLNSYCFSWFLETISSSLTSSFPLRRW